MTGALAGVKVLDLSRVLAGPHCTQTLADLGATVWKIESLTGDDTRSWGPPFLEVDGQRQSAYFMSANRGKRSLAVNLRDGRGQALIRQLAAQADVLIENFKVGDLERYGLDYASLAPLNPRLIYASVTGFGQTGPRATEAGYDAALQGYTGIMALTGEPHGEPTKVGVAWIDLMTGMQACIGILAALQERHHSGQGQYIDVSLFETGLAALANIGQNFLLTGQEPGRIGNAHSQIVPYGNFAVADGHIILAVGNDSQFAALCGVLGHPEWASDPRFATNPDRVTHRGPLTDLLGGELRLAPREHWLPLLQAVRVPSAPVNRVSEAFSDPQAHARGMRWRSDHPVLGQADLIGSPLGHLSRTPARPSSAPPLLGEHTHEVLTQVLRLGEEEIGVLREAGVIA